MEFELALSKEQKQRVSDILVNGNTRTNLWCMAIEHMLSVWSSAMIVFGLVIHPIVIFTGIIGKVIGFLMLRCMYKSINRHKVFMEVKQYRCTIIDIDTIKLSEGSKRSDLTGQRVGRMYKTNGPVEFKLKGERIVAKNMDIIVGDTALLVEEGNREHLAVIEGLRDYILIAVSLIDERYKNLTIEELERFAKITSEKGIDNIDIDEELANSSFRKAIESGNVIDKSTKRKLKWKIQKQFYMDYEGRSLWQELGRRILAVAVIVGGVIWVLNYAESSMAYMKIFGDIGVEYINGIKIVVGLILGIQMLFMAWYIVFRNDIAKQLSKTKEPRILNATIQYEDEENKEDIIHYKYKLITENGDIIHNVYSRDDIYIHHKAQYGEVEVIVCDKMLAIYPKGYLFTD